jgi:hypothetical protein
MIQKYRNAIAKRDQSIESGKKQIEALILNVISLKENKNAPKKNSKIPSS